ncbi:PspC domain-containing protein [Rhodothermus profundi]|uniref:Phage shock protein C (PspC) family protein n=1 Tax=Rhodothermus profundi TaxID=633813 RepID=A0A1M6PN90_9BACT|nr:PspC domain-containing protein [Rhodothermus profundi]SHK09429.1 phage shock protein C (PspC) family protein [Rhodothermus profundi]
MATRTRTQSLRLESEEADALELEQLSDAELEQLLFGEEGSTSRRDSVWNLPTVAGLAFLLVGVVYVLQQIGLWEGVDLSTLVGFLPWVAALLIILLGLGVLSWRPRRRTHRRKKAKPRAQTQKSLDEVFEQPRKAFEELFEELRTTFSSSKGASTTTKGAKSPPPASRTKRLVKSRDRMLAGVCGGIAEYFGWDPTLIRALFVLGAIFSSGFPFIIVYLILAWIMPEPSQLEKSEDDEPRITILPE